jgi:hypothetical protein
LPPLQVPALVAPVAHIDPGDTHELPKQQPPPVQVDPAQQTVPGSPHREQTCELGLHAVLASVQVLPGQQASPAAPQWTQAVPPQRVLGAVHRLPAQQGWPGPPQVPHDPALQLPGTMPQLVPAPAHMQPTQQPPPLQTLPAQQGPPGVPHAMVVPASVTMVAPSCAPPLSSLASPPPGWETSAGAGPSLVICAPPSGWDDTDALLHPALATPATRAITNQTRSCFKTKPPRRRQHRPIEGRCARISVLARQLFCVDDDAFMPATELT